MIDLFTEIPVPPFIEEGMRSPAMKRIAGIDMNCGMCYTSFPLFKNGEPYSRAQHSRNVSLLVYHFTKDSRQALAGLFHDIATPVFSHVIDFLNGDYLTQESTEERTSEMICRDPVIQNLLATMEIKSSEVSDYHCYPVADNDMPRLSCDRLEYTLGNAVNYRFITPEKCTEYLSDIQVMTNESGETELGFLHAGTAAEFARTALKCGRIYSGAEDRYGMEILARLLKDAIMDGVLTENDLYLDEAAVISILLNSSYRERWNAFTALHKVTECGPDEGICINAKRRYVDPLIYGQGRASEYDSALKQEINEFITENYSVYLKGI